MRRLFLVFIAACGVVTPAAAHAGDANTVVVRNPIVTDYNGPFDAGCGFPLVAKAHTEELIKTQFQGLPRGVDPYSGPAVVYAVWGEHWTVSHRRADESGQRTDVGRPTYGAPDSPRLGYVRFDVRPEWRVQRDDQRELMTSRCPRY